MKILSKMLIVLVIAVFSFTLMPTTSMVYADVTDIMENVKADTNKVGDTSGITTVSSRILTILQILSGVFAILMLAITGFKYIVETPEVKKELKGTMVPIVVGILLVFFATTIAKFFINLFTNVS